MSLQEQAILVSLSIKSWAARKNDKETTNEILSNKNAAPKAGNFTKRLLNKDCIAKYMDVATNARAYHRSVTLPWTEGKGMLPMKLYQQYVEHMNEFKDQYEIAYREFLDNYDSFVQWAQNELNGLYRPEDYPLVDKMQKKFGFSVEFEPIPNTNDLRISMSDSDRAEIKKNIEDHVNWKQEQAMKDLWRRLYECVNNMQEILSNEKGRVHESLLEKMIDITNILPDMNLTNDTNLENMRQEIVSKLCSHDITDLRKDKAVRYQVASDAKTLADAMAGYIGDEI